MIAETVNLFLGAVLINPRTEYRITHHYQGRIKGVILDWAGTVVDCGVYAPAVAFIEVFKREGIVVSMEEAREPMGAHKKVHIRKMTEIESVRRKWLEKFNRYPNEEDVERMFTNFVPLQVHENKNFVFALLFLLLPVYVNNEIMAPFMCYLRPHQ